jgi:outer membrane protein assembly factor BamB
VVLAFAAVFAVEVLQRPRLRGSTILLLLALGAAAVLPSSPARGADWPEWRGAGRRGVWTEDGILERYPAQGLTFTWRVPIREGHAGPAVAAGRVFVTDFARGEGLEGTERALCLDELTGKVLWQQEWEADYSGTQPTWANGPRATPTVDGDRVYVVGASGRLVALDAVTGRLLWRRDYVADFRATLPAWGVVSAPIVDGGRLIALVGGEKDALVVAFDKLTGQEVWRALPSNGDAGYAPLLIIEAGGARQLVVWHPRAISALDPATGRLLWEQPFEVSMGMTVATPVFDGGRLLVSAFFDGAMLVALDAEAPRAKLVWHRKGRSEQPADTDGLHALITTPVLDGDFIYGIDSYGELRGLRAATGERLWASTKLTVESARWAAGLVVRHGDRYFVQTDRGDLVIARFSPSAYEEIDRTRLIEPTSKGGGRRELQAVHWSHPAYANRHVVVRNDREIVRASLVAPAPPAPPPDTGAAAPARPGSGAP